MSAPSTAGGRGRPLIRLRGVSKIYLEGEERHRVLHRAAIDIDAGELVVLVGRSGSGKSTLLNLISGIDLPTEGDVLIDGVALNLLSERERTLFRRRHIGFVFQSFNLLPTLTVEENMLLPLQLNGQAADADLRRARSLLREVGLADRSRSFPDRLSGGEQQRLAIVRALVHRPLLVLADEPTGNLDLETGLEVVDLLDRLTRRSGHTLLMVTHSREMVGLADRLLRIEDGHLAEQALPARALSPP